jgi:hypothetical protein
MTDEQFDEICRGALAYEPGAARDSVWSKIRPSKWSWLPTIPEVLSCGCACGLILVGLSVQFGQKSEPVAEANPFIQRAMGRPLAGLQVSAVQFPDSTPWTELTLTLPSASGAKKGGLH